MQRLYYTEVGYYCSRADGLLLTEKEGLAGHTKTKGNVRSTEELITEMTAITS